eukprot:m.333131 g.333131  ORF g.333131 m.333131 type:complete len:94 (-) comp55646_c1_seq5:67-348(-)
MPVFSSSCLILVISCILDQEGPSAVLEWFDEPFNGMDDERLNTLDDFLRATFKDKPPRKVVIHGITPPGETPLQFLSEFMCYPDNFVHLCVFL